jgi:hypothetical protein
MPATCRAATRFATKKEEWPEENQRLNEGGLQPDLEGSDGASMLTESCFEMSQGVFRRVPRSALRRLAHSAECRANRTLYCEKSFPDPVGRGTAQSALELLEGLHFVAGTGRLFQEAPQTLSGQEQAFDLVRDPDAESPSTAGRSATVAAENSPAADCFRLLILFVIATQKPVPDQIPNAAAMRASCYF